MTRKEAETLGRKMGLRGIMPRQVWSIVLDVLEAHGRPSATARNWASAAQSEAKRVQGRTAA